MSKRVANNHSQQGAATVESAIIISVFLLLVMAIIEFALLIFNASSLVEASRAGARYLIVNDPVTDLTAGGCDIPVNCSTGDCDSVLGIMQRFYPPLTESNIEITYRCSSTGNDEAYFDIYEVELVLKDVEYSFVTPGIFMLFPGEGDEGMFTVELPDFKTTRLSEDMETVVPESE